MRKRLAVVGTGISGLSAAWLLDRAHDVVVYEAEPRLGGHAHTDAASTGGRETPVDTGFIVYNAPTYPNLTALFDTLGVETRRSDMSFGVSLDDGGFEYSSARLSSYLTNPSTLANPRFWIVAREVFRFYRTAPDAMRALADEGLSLGEFLDACGYHSVFQDEHILPQAAAIWSCSIDDIRAYPAQAFVAFCDTHGLMRFSGRPKWRTVAGGSRAYVDAIARTLRGQVRLHTRVVAVQRRQAGVEVRDIHGGVDTFDDVVLATHADQSLDLLSDPTPEEAALLGAFRYKSNVVALHGDAAVMPRRKAWWSAWNYLGPRGGQAPLVSYWMNPLQGLDPAHDLFVTLNPPDRTLAGELWRGAYLHPMFDAAAVAAQRRLWSLQGRRRTWFCGAYFGAGFHEDGLQAGLAVAEDLGGTRRPWTVAAPSGRIFREERVAPDRVGVE